MVNKKSKKSSENYISIKKSRIYCNVCKNDNLHELVSKSDHTYYDSFWGYNRLVECEIWKCCGCEYPSFRMIEHPLEFMTGKKDKDLTKVHFFPERESDKRERKYFFKSPRLITKLYEEVLLTFNKEAYILCTAGLRVLLEAICTDKGVVSTDDGRCPLTLEKKIDLLGKIVPKHIVDTLHDFRFIGNKAIHKLAYPDAGDLYRALNVIEDLMGFFYELDFHAEIYRETKSPKKVARNNK